MLTYDGRKIVPAPLVTLNKSYRNTEDGQKLGSLYDITLTGTLLPFRGSPSGHYPSPDTAFWTQGGAPTDEPFNGNSEDFNSILRKQEAIRWLFSRDGRSLEWQPDSGQPVVKCNPRALEVNFGEGTWADRCNYTVRLQANWLYINGSHNCEDVIASGLISQADESWEFQEEDGWDGSGYRVTHTLTANGVLGYNENGDLYGGKTGWEHAQAWCESRSTSGVDPAIMLASIGQSGWVGGDYSRTVTASKTTGQFGITEKWLVCPSTTFTVRTYTVDYNTQDDVYRVRCDGVVYGTVNGQRLGSQAALDAARAAVPTTAAARTDALAMVGSLLGGQALGIAPDSRGTVLNKMEGTVSFTFEWTTSEDANFTQTFEASLSYSNDSGLWGMTLTQIVVGKGNTPAERMAHARAAALNDAAARAKALEIIGASLPSGVTINNTPKSRSTGINDKQGRLDLAWGWDSSPDHNLEVSIQKQNRAAITAVLPIPGRQPGPVIQDMDTVTEKLVSINIRGRDYATEPDSNAMLAMANGYLGVVAEGFIIVGDSETWNPINKTYERSIRYLVLEGH